MNKTEFLQKFQYQRLTEPTQASWHHDTLKAAAVLVPLVEKRNSLDVLLTKRASHLKHHGGQISFPGGKAEPEDESLIATAMREAREEIGLSPDNVEIIGQLNPYQTISGYIVTPVIGFVPGNLDYQADDNEVAEIFQVPLQHFLNSRNHQTLQAQLHGQQHQVHFMPYQNYNIWGATAAMLKDLAEHLV
ncbi:CoA pyrophosphatase [Thalassomonas viridans]|uniref:CoA pyrophosphatase n=1 Tax=Thalassomonas viridans TaxID=137584 RepID=A0AAE9Z7C0_9GAMM|nr:CoA pyrophosphatase [Thalassomonas viridans]WDE07324.1 CoA pyrophosphatase [Thalassomonas viridans]